MVYRQEISLIIDVDGKRGSPCDREPLMLTWKERRWRKGSNRWGDSIAPYLNEYEMMIHRRGDKCFDEIQVDNANCAPFDR